MAESENWCTIESDPGVFTELISEIGVKDIQVEEIYDISEKDKLERMKPIYGLIFLFKWRAEEKDERIPTPQQQLWFANQTINNACATQAIMSILLNNPEIDLGDTLREFREFSLGLPFDERGWALGALEKVRKAHNSFARSEAFSIENTEATEDDDEIYHFISYIYFDGGVWELDGLKKGPFFLNTASKDNWTDRALPFIQERIEKYAKSEIRFNLMAVVKNRKTIYTQDIQTLQTEISTIEGLLRGDSNRQQEQSNLPSSKEELEQLRTRKQRKIEELNQSILEEDEKFQNWKAENVRRRHNYVPFLVNVLQAFAQKGVLGNLIEKARSQGPTDKEEK